MRQSGRTLPGMPGFVAPMGPAAPFLAIGASVLGTGLSVMGQAQQASAQSAQANYQAEVARRNAALAEWNAKRAEEQGRINEQNTRLKTGQAIGAQRAALAAQGADVNSGSPLDVQADTARAGEFDALTVRNNAALQAYGFRVQEAGLQGTASAYSAAAANTQAALPYTIGSSLLGGASSVAEKWSRYFG